MRAFQRQASKAPRPLRVAIGAGGTGGHIYPGLAVAQAVRERDPHAEVRFFGVRGRLEEAIVPRFGYRLHTTRMVGSVGRTVFTLPLLLCAATLRCRRILREWGADVVIGMGGYPSLPVVLAAATLRKPIIIHESNAVVGRANRLASLVASNIALVSEQPGRRAFTASGEVRVVGMPLLRRGGQESSHRLRAIAREHFGVAEGQCVVLVVGGSLGATSVTRAAVEAALLADGREAMSFIIKTGPTDEASARAALVGAANAHVHSYIDRMDLAYAAADIVVSRAGASTVAELADEGLPSVLVPYPHAVGDHQRHNAERLVNAGAAIVLDDRELDGIGLLAHLVGINNPQRLAAMRDAAASLRVPGAAEAIASWMFDLARRHERSGQPSVAMQEVS